MDIEDSKSRPWGAETLARREGRRGKRRGWLTTPQQLLERAKQLDPRAVSQLYTRYRRPIMSFLRQYGAPEHLVEDVTQGFFTGVLARGSFATLDPGAGSFGAWLRRGALHQYYNERKRFAASKRLLGAPQVAEICDEMDAGQAPTCDRLLDQRRAALLIDEAWLRLRQEYQSLGRELLFDHLKRTLSRGERAADGAESDAVLCEQLGISASCLAVRRHRLKAEEFPAAMLAVLQDQRSREQSSGSRRPGALTAREELRALLDDLA